jgi:hypothetical protein
MRQLTIALAIALCLLRSDPIFFYNVPLLTGADSCYAGGQSPSYAGVLIPDVQYGTRIAGKGPVMWPSGYTGVRLAGNQVAVRDTSGSVVATTGREYAIAPAPGQEARKRIGAIAAPQCYAWDFVDCTAALEAAGDPGGESRYCRVPPTFDVAVVRANIAAECGNPVVLEEETCTLIDMAGAKAIGVYLYVPLKDPTNGMERARMLCEQIESVHDLDGRLGFENVVIEGQYKLPVAKCHVDLD